MLAPTLAVRRRQVAARRATCRRRRRGHGRRRPPGWVAGSRLGHRDTLLGPRLEQYRRALARLTGLVRRISGRRIAGGVPDAAGHHDLAGGRRACEGRPLDHARVARDARAVPRARARGVCRVGPDESAPVRRGEASRPLSRSPERCRRCRRGGKKVAFRVPLAEWLRGPLRAGLESQLEHCWIYEDGWFHREAARGLVARAPVGGRRPRRKCCGRCIALGCWSPS